MTTRRSGTLDGKAVHSREDIPTDKIIASPCDRSGTRHAGALVSLIVCPACGRAFTECERCFDSDNRCIPCLRDVVRSGRWPDSAP